MKTAENIPLKGLTSIGDVVWYTGRVGGGWISNNRAEAFTYTVEGARRKASQLNVMTEVHGIRFVAVVAEQEPTAHHTRECLTKGDATRCPVCAPINEKAELVAALKALRRNIDVSTIGKANYVRTQWAELAKQADVALAKAEGKVA